MADDEPKTNELSESGESEEGSVAADTGGELTSPEGVLMMSLAVTADLVGLVPVVNIFSDIIAGIIFLIWMLGTGKKGWVSFAISIIVELIPIVSDIAPFVSWIALFFGKKWPVSWTGCVYKIISSQ